MRRLPCPDCGRAIRPSNMGRHRRARHLPKAVESVYGTRYKLPAMPIRVGASRDRRHDEIAPRGVGPHRYRIYRLRGGDLQLVSAVATAQAMGRELVDLHTHGAFVGDDSVGVLDTAEDPGHWIVSPFTLGRRAPDG